MATIASVTGVCPMSRIAALNLPSNNNANLKTPSIPSISGLRPVSLTSSPSSAALFGLSHDISISKRPLVFPRAAVEAPAVPKQKIRIKLRSYWVNLIEDASKQILDVAKETGSGSMGPVRLPTHRRIYCVLRSPHVDKDSREHFQVLTHKRLIDLVNPTAQTIDALMQLDIAAGVDVEVKLQ